MNHAVHNKNVLLSNNKQPHRKGKVWRSQRSGIKKV